MFVASCDLEVGVEYSLRKKDVYVSKARGPANNEQQEESESETNPELANEANLLKDKEK